MAETCTHLGSVADITPSSDGCEDCLRTGGRWIHLRDQGCPRLAV